MKNEVYSQIVRDFVNDLKREFAQKEEVLIEYALQVLVGPRIQLKIDGSCVEIVDGEILYNALDGKFYFNGESPSNRVWSSILFEIRAMDLIILPEPLKVAMIDVASTKKDKIIPLKSSYWLPAS